MTTDGKVFGKFNVTRTDGQSESGRKHDGCDYFVLDTTCDEFALHALRAYIDACKETHPKLAADMERLYRVPRKGNPMTDARTKAGCIDPDLAATIRFELQSIYVHNCGRSAAQGYEVPHLERAAKNIELCIQAEIDKARALINQEKP